MPPDIKETYPEFICPLEDGRLRGDNLKREVFRRVSGVELYIAS